MTPNDMNIMTHASTEPLVDTDEAFSGGPSDRSVLTGFVDHVAYMIRISEERLVLKAASHGSKLKNFPESPMSEEVMSIGRDFYLLDFAECFLTMLDASLLSAFVERWHPETSSFHLPFGEMIVTLDDVDQLFHILVADSFFTQVVINHLTVVHIIVDDLEMFEEDMLKKFSETRGYHLQMSWLRKLYGELVEARRYQTTARAYMLHLVACTLFEDKSGVYIDVRYLSLFSMRDTLCWAWGVAALAMLYKTLDIASHAETRQFAGYLILLQCWIYEYFPHICERKIQRVSTTLPCTRRCKCKQAYLGGSIEYNRRLDALTLEDIVWTPYTAHRPHRPFKVSTLYPRHIRWETHMARHLPERCLCQYGYVHGIPRPIPDTLAGGNDGWFLSHILSYPMRSGIQSLRFNIQDSVRMDTWSGFTVCHTLGSYHQLQHLMFRGLQVSKILPSQHHHLYLPQVIKTAAYS